MSTRNQPCPCCSGKPYVLCCQRYHQGMLPENAMLLMRSRYSAYALGVVPYLIETTHPQSPHFLSDKKQWSQQLRAFSQQVTFEKLDILETHLGEMEAFVTFVAHLRKGETDLTFTERSRFIRQEQAWKYIDGKIAKGCLTEEQIKHLS